MKLRSSSPGRARGEPRDRFRQQTGSPLNVGFQARRNWYPPTAGSSVHVHQVATQLQARGHRLHTLLPGCTAPRVQCYDRRQLVAYLRAIDVQYIRIFGAWQLGKFSLLKLLRRRRLPVVWEVNAPLEEHLLTGYTASQLRRMYREIRLLAPLADLAVCVTEPLADYVKSAWGVRRVEVVASGSDPGMFSPDCRCPQNYPELADCFKVIWAGSPQYAWQGASFLVEVAKRMLGIDRQVRFIVVGRPQPFQAAGPLPPNLILLGQRPYLEMPGLLASADAGFCPCLDDDLGIGFYRAPLKLFDYMASGLPALVSHNSETTKIIQPGVNGLAFDNRVDSAVDAILTLRRDPQLAARLAAHAAKAW